MKEGKIMLLGEVPLRRIEDIWKGLQNRGNWRKGKKGVKSAKPFRYQPD
jgi:hypothetical protein